MEQTPSPARARAHAAQAVLHVLEYNRTIDWILENKPHLTGTALERELFQGTVRHCLSLTASVEKHLQKDLRAKDTDLFCLMLVGAYQLKYSHIPAHAAVHETVSATKPLGKPWARGLVNAILRQVGRAPSEELDQSFDHPEWLATMLRSDYPEDWQSILSANNTRAPMSLRINVCRTSPTDYMESLAARDIAYQAGALSECVTLVAPRAATGLPGWTNGHVAVQDMGAQFAAHLLHENPAAEHRSLDACAAPGGKLAHLLERTWLESQSASLNPVVQAIDISPRRVAETQKILQRLGHNADLKVGDARHLDWWDGQPYTHILLDAPCSGTGTIRRHPDIKLLLTPSALEAHADLQITLLNNLWQTLAPGGTLLYCTCSLLAAENDDVIGRFLNRNNKDTHVLDIKLPTGRKTRYGWQLLPTDPSTDGFFYARLQKA